jgi:hypothetical protein
MIQVYCDTEQGINNWLKDHQDVEIVDFRMAFNNQYSEEWIMVVYKTKE